MNVIEQQDSWPSLLEAFSQTATLLPQEWAPIFGPLRTGARDAMLVLGQLGQTLDGRIATVTGHSKYINGPAGLTHLHRLRAVVDAVAVGVGTAVADNPRLNVRLVTGQHPARVVIDPKARLDPNALVWSDDGARRIVIVADHVKPNTPAGVEVISLPSHNGQLAPAEILKALFALGLKRILIEGGADTVSRFMQAGCLDRLHVIVAPIIMGSGRPGFSLPAIEHMDQAVRIKMHPHPLEDEMLFDCDLSAQRVKLV
jgi:diaminohydroxyphosphoribosylaminopyrimidine deaminase / 5-amino-6-(5-phosphoribosylamino)uracil reductase